MSQPKVRQQLFLEQTDEPGLTKAGRKAQQEAVQQVPAIPRDKVEEAQGGEAARIARGREASSPEGGRNSRVNVRNKETSVNPREASSDLFIVAQARRELHRHSLEQLLVLD